MLNEGILSQSQLGIYLECLKKDGIHTLITLFEIDAGLDIQRLAQAVEAAAKAHPYVNIRIIEREGKPFQYIPENISYKPEILRLSESDWQKTLLKSRTRNLIFMVSFSES